MIQKISKIYIILLLLILTGAKNYLIADIPPNHQDLKEPISYEEMKSFLEEVDKKENISVSIEGASVQGRSLSLVHLRHETNQPNIPVFFFGQQHGNEPAGKDALIYLIKYISNNPQLLPENIDLWIMPMVNPDGASNNQRRNGNKADLNRDHQLLSQPETQVLHKVFRKIMPLVAVDCHEFGRDSKDYTQKGWTEWPRIMMDCCNNPLFNPKVYELGVSWCDGVADELDSVGHNYTRYFVGGIPPEEEQRYSTPEVNDARNGLGSYGGLTFIIESGLFHNSEDENADLAQRIDAYLILLKQLIIYSANDSKLIELVDKSRKEQIFDFIPTNYFWGNAGYKKSIIKVISEKTGEVVEIPTMNFMKDLVVKGSIKTPKAYIVENKNAQFFIELLNRHEIQYSVLKKPAEYLTQSSNLISFENFRDSLYNRYEDRQIVQPGKIENRLFPANSIYIVLNNEAARRTALLLEPSLLYGLYQYEEFRKLIEPNGIIPVWRVGQ